ncbi:MAG: hypothetical protein D6729_16265 [Deltaproteobacteria bacterium]|nr:MAG: hypothetical protein D6729_16265 [Deltaproteobacteria bacterium]
MIRWQRGRAGLALAALLLTGGCATSRGPTQAGEAPHPGTGSVAAAAAQKQPARVIVRPLAVGPETGLDDAAASVLASALCEGLQGGAAESGAEEEVTCLTPQEVDELLSLRAMQQTMAACEGEGCAASPEEILAADYVVLVELSGPPPTTLRARLLRVESAEPVAEAAQREAGMAELQQAAFDVGMQLRRALP